MRTPFFILFLVAALALCSVDSTLMAAQETPKAEPAAQKKNTKNAQDKRGRPETPRLYPTQTLQATNFTLTMPTEVEEGGMVLAQVQASSNISTVTLNWRTKNHTIAMLGGQGLALLPAPLEPEKRTMTLQITAGTESLKIPVRIMPVRWPVQRLTVEPKFVDPPADTMSRIAADRERTKAALATVRPERFWAPPFVRPVQGEVSSAYGGKRVFNEKPRSRHRGVDLRGPMGTPIRSIGAGRVLLAEDQYFSGNVVYVDHGQGLVTIYCHMSEMHATPGQVVAPGDVLGLVGATGRVTGPHLHLSTLLHGESVNPMALFLY